MIIAIVAVSGARILSIEGLFRAVQGPLGIYALDRKQRRHLVLGGTRGAIVLALALSLPVEFDNWYTLQSMAYGLVFFTLAVHPIAALWSAKRSR